MKTSTRSGHEKLTAKRRHFLLSFSCLMSLLPFTLHAQVTGSLDQAFNSPLVAGPHPLWTAVQPDGKILIAGYFTNVNGEPHNRILRLHADGTVESTATFDPGSGANDWIDCMAVQVDGKIVIAGRFTSVNGQPRNHIARLNPNGTLESTATFNPGSGVGGLGYVWSIAVQPDGKILLGGGFDAVNGLPRQGIARLNADGSVESTTTFNPGTGANPGFSSNVVSVAVQADGKILLAGDFTTINDQPRNHIARLNADGTLESTATFNPGTGANTSVQCVAVQPDGKILLGGYFTSVNGQPRNHIARLNPNGALESTATFNPGTGVDGSTGPVYTVISMAVQVDGKILLSGDFTSVNGQPRNRIARLNPDGSLESTGTFNPGTGANDIVYSVALQRDGKILLGGTFTSIDGQPRQHLARLANDAATESLAIPSNARVQWFRSGAAPEVEQVSFDLSTNGGANWIPLGAGTRVVGGWERDGLSIPANGLIRARGRTAGSYHNGTSGMVESITSISAVFGGINDALVASYPFSGNANDQSGRAHHGTVHGATLTVDRFGSPTSAYHFDGQSSIIEVPDHDDLDLTEDFSLSVWARPLNQTAWMRMFGKHMAGPALDGTWFIIQHNPIGQANFSATPFFDPLTTSIHPMRAGDWNHVVFTYKKNTANWKMYLDGNLDSSGVRVYDIRNTPLRMVIGADENNTLNPPYGGYFHGDLDDIRIYKRVLSPTEVRSLSSSPLSIAGAVSSSLGPIISGAAIRLKRLGSVFWEGLSDTDGFFSPPPMLAQNYTVTVTKSGYLTHVSSHNGTAGGTQPLHITMVPLPGAPVVADANQTPPPTAVRPPAPANPLDPNAPRLLRYDGAGHFTPMLTGLNPNRMTVVISHGWKSDPSAWALPLALLIHQHHALGANVPNIVAWDWQVQANTPLPTPDPATEQGIELGKALRTALGTGYSRHLHFIGHSLGTIVNCYACDFVHGSFARSRNNPASPWSPLLTTPHITLLDEAELATVFGSNVTTAASIGWKVAQLKGALVAGGAAAAADWKNPIPREAKWVDSYISLVGLQRSGAVNVCLLAPTVSFDWGSAWSQVQFAHSYAHSWYRNSVWPTGPAPAVGFGRSFEAGSAFPPSGAGLSAGSLWFEYLATPDPLDLRRDNNPESFECNLAILSALMVQPAAGLATLGNDYIYQPLDAAGRLVLDKYEAGIEWAGDIGGTVIYRTGQVITETREKIGNWWDAAQDRASDVLNSIGPDTQLLGPVAAPVMSLRLTTQPTPGQARGVRGGGATPGQPAYARMTLNVPANAGMLAFDFTVTGDPVEDCVACAVNGQNVFTLSAKYAPEDSPVSTDMLDVSAYAGQSIELFFGLTGGTSTNCSVTVDGIRFITIPQPNLAAFVSGTDVALKWPAAAIGWILETSDSLAAGSWQPVPLTGVSVAEGVVTLVQPVSGRKFYRLRLGP